MAKRAMHGVKLHAVFQIFVRGRQRIVDARRVALHGSIDGAHRQMTLEVRGFDVGRSREESEHRETETTQDEDEKSDDYAESELAHEASGITIVADAGADD